MWHKVRFTVKHLGRLWRAAPVLWKYRADQDLRRAMRSYTGTVPLCVFSEPLRWLPRLVRAGARYQVANQRPHTFYMPDLPAHPFADADQTSALLSANGQDIIDEYEGVAASQVASPSTALTSAGDWKTFPLIRAAKKFEDNIERCPKTWAVVKQCPLPKDVRGGVYFSILDPGTKIDPHCGPSNLKYRYHLTIKPSDGAKIRSGSEWKTWAPGGCLILDDSFDHEVRHDGQNRRVVLIVDCWHPDLTDKEKTFLTELHRRW